MTETTPQHPDPAVSADDNHGADVPTEEAAAASTEALDPAHGPVPDGSPLAGSDPIGSAVQP